MDTLPLAPWAHPLCGWDATPDLAKATWEWPAWGEFKRFPKTRVLHSDRVRAIEPQAFWNQKPHMQRQFYGN